MQWDVLITYCVCLLLALVVLPYGFMWTCHKIIRGGKPHQKLRLFFAFTVFANLGTICISFPFGMSMMFIAGIFLMLGIPAFLISMVCLWVAMLLEQLPRRR